MIGSALNWRAFSSTAAAVCFALCTGACGGRHPAGTAGQEESANDSATVRAAKQPLLNIYNWADYVGHNTIAEFERRTHIKVVYELYDSNETLEAWIS